MGTGVITARTRLDRERLQRRHGSLYRARRRRARHPRRHLLSRVVPEHGPKQPLDPRRAAVRALPERVPRVERRLGRVQESPSPADFVSRRRARDAAVRLEDGESRGDGLLVRGGRVRAAAGKAGQARDQQRLRVGDGRGGGRRRRDVVVVRVIIIPRARRRTPTRSVMARARRRASARGRRRRRARRRGRGRGRDARARRHARRDATTAEGARAEICRRRVAALSAPCQLCVLAAGFFREVRRDRSPRRPRHSVDRRAHHSTATMPPTTTRR
jgi:hypothetical protein